MYVNFFFEILASKLIYLCKSCLRQCTTVQVTRCWARVVISTSLILIRLFERFMSMPVVLPVRLTSTIDMHRSISWSRSIIPFNRVLYISIVYNIYHKYFLLSSQKLLTKLFIIFSFIYFFSLSFKNYYGLYFVF